MKASELFPRPSVPTADRQVSQDKILQAIADGHVLPVQWSAIRSTLGARRAILYVSSDVLMLGEPDDFVRVVLSAEGSQRACDLLGVSLPTAKISDLIYAQASVRLSPHPQSPCTNTVGAMLRHNDAIERERAGRPGLVSTVGKDWVLTNKIKGRLDIAANYGWHKPGGGMWQPLSTMHNRFHCDYSQSLRLVSQTVIVDGGIMSLADVAGSAELAGLVSSDGVLQVLRQPGVPEGEPTAMESIPVPPLEEGINQSLEDPIPLVQARHYTLGPRRGSVDLIVIHTMEAAEKPTTAVNVATWFAGPNAPQASAHYCVDSEHVVQCVRDDDIAWHAPGVNHCAIGIEHAGYAKQSAADWRDAFSSAMLERSARLCAKLCLKHELPVEFVDADGLLAGRRGITTHWEVTKAFHKSTHTDPGKSFPMDAFIAQVSAAS